MRCSAPSREVGFDTGPMGAYCEWPLRTLSKLACHAEASKMRTGLWHVSVMPCDCVTMPHAAPSAI